MLKPGLENSSVHDNRSERLQNSQNIYLIINSLAEAQSNQHALLKLNTGQTQGIWTNQSHVWQQNIVSFSCHTEVFMKLNFKGYRQCRSKLLKSHPKPTANMTRFSDNKIIAELMSSVKMTRLRFHLVPERRTFPTCYLLAASMQFEDFLKLPELDTHAKSNDYGAKNVNWAIFDKDS